MTFVTIIKQTGQLSDKLTCMANTREINRRAERFFTKRQRLNVKGSYHDRLALPDDLDVYSRDAHVTLARRIPVESARSTPRGQPWLERHGWEPEDNRELGLVPSADWADDVNDPRRDSASSNAKTRQKGKKLPVSNMLTTRLLPS